jgi:hypothetical protein
MTRWVTTTEELPTGTHALALYGSRAEAARNIVGFLKGGANRAQPGAVWTDSEEMLRLYRTEVERVVPSMRESFHRLSGAHTEPTPDGRRPLPQIVSYLAGFPEGVSTVGDTIPHYLDRQNLAEYLDYERWFDSQRPYAHRGLCPYDITALPVDQAAKALLGLARSHTHAVLSEDPDPGVRLLQLLVAPQLENPPRWLIVWLDRAADQGLIEFGVSGETATLTLRGVQLARALLAMRT